MQLTASQPSGRKGVRESRAVEVVQAYFGILDCSAAVTECQPNCRGNVYGFSTLLGHFGQRFRSFRHSRAAPVSNAATLARSAPLANFFSGSMRVLTSERTFI